MKNTLALFLILISGCSSIPYKIEDIRVRETYTINRDDRDPTLIGCKVYVVNIITNYPVSPDKVSEYVTGIVTCDKESGEESFSAPAHIPFEDIREDYTFRRQYERGLTNND